MFPPEEWDTVVAEHAAPNALLVAVDDRGEVVGFTAVHPLDCEMYLLFVHPKQAGRGVGRALLEGAHEGLKAAGYQRDGTVRESDFRGIHQREPRLIKTF